jgi:hypothetical protein
VSGLHIGDPRVDSLPIQLFADFVSGFVGASSVWFFHFNAAVSIVSAASSTFFNALVFVQMAASIAQVIIAGNSITSLEVSDSHADKPKVRFFNGFEHICLCSL